MGSRKGAKAKGNAHERKLEICLEGIGFSVRRGSGADQSKFKAPDLFVPAGRSDPVPVNCGRVRPSLAIEAKDHKSWPWKTWVAAYEQGAKASVPHGSDVIVAVVAHRHGTSEDYALISWNDLLRLYKDAYG